MIRLLEIGFNRFCKHYVLHLTCQCSDDSQGNENKLKKRLFGFSVDELKVELWLGACSRYQFWIGVENENEKER